ncbi:MAG: LamG domain-containing protein [Gammaproteobacteria bacterium]|nr:LamG domain-containing protein [Gammaproteobacteria bacterium]
MKVIKMNLRTLIAIAVGILILQGCGTGSGAAVSTNPVTTTADVSNYNGPPPATADVQSFKLAMWDNLVPNNRCGSCHNTDQTPRFVRSDDINLAYDAANTVVDLTDPAMSTIVAKVRGGHNCWLSDNNACGDIIQSYVENWAGATLGGAGKTIQLVAPATLNPPGQSKNFPDDPALFSTTVHPLLTQYCANCHTDAAAIPQQPFFASADVAAAYDAAKTKMDLETPANSRFVLRLGNEFHNCWDNCSANASEMLVEITNFSNAVPVTEVDPDLVTSMALGLPDGIISSAGGRFEANAIALYEFKTGAGNQVFDTSGVEPSLNLTLSGTYNWVGGWGVQFTAGKAQGSTTASAKLEDLLSSTGEFSIEAWVAPGNVTQDGPARIVTYSGGSTTRNFMLGQTLYDYNSFARTDQTDQAGEPQLSTPAADEVLQATLQHVVLNYDPINGRAIYVNGELRSNTDPVPGGLLNEWDDTYAFAIGSEVDNQNRWAGTVRLLAVHNRILTQEQITQNFEVGVGEKYYLLFNVSDHINIPDAYVVIEVSQFDSYAYLFDEPFFAVLGAGVTLGNIPVQGMRIGENGRELEVGQAFANMDVTINDVDYAVEGVQRMSSLGTVVPLEKGADLDEFFLTFEVLGSSTNVVIEPVPLTPAAPPPVPRDPPTGIRNFAEVNATMSKLTGIPISNPDVAGTYNAVFQAMPVQTGIGGFISSQQMGITQLAIKYCAVLVDDTNARASYWPNFNWSAGLGTAFNDRAAVTDPLMANMVGLALPTQPAVADLEGEVNALIDRLVNCGGNCEPDRVERVMKGACASVLGSAAMLVQ